MNKKMKKTSALFLTVGLCVSLNSQVWALEPMPENELILQGEQIETVTGEEIMVGGVADLPEEETMVSGTYDIKTQATSMEMALVNAQVYLKAHTTNPVVATNGGEWSVIALARNNNLDANVKERYLANLYSTLDKTQGILSNTKYTEYERVVMALTSIGVTPDNVNGYNLLAPLADFRTVSKQGINSSIFALIALDTANYPMPSLSEEDIAKGKEQATREKYIQVLLNRELAGGGWTLMGNNPDADITAMAIQALTPYCGSMPKVQAAVERGIQKLSQMQTATGGFESWGTENVESTAQTIIALAAYNPALLESEQFIKNGKTLFDGLLRFQNVDGSFSHIYGSGADGMATDQANLALVAYDRAVKGKTSLYNMTDIMNGVPGPQEENESEENIRAFKDKLDKLPKQPTIDDKQTIYGLVVELEGMKNFKEKEAFKNHLQKQLDEIKIQEQEVTSLSDDIWKNIQPLKITLRDKPLVEKLMAKYQGLSEANKKHVLYAEDLLRANSIVVKLEKTIIAKEIFENVKHSNVDYVYHNDNYKVKISGKNAYVPADMKATLEIVENQEILEFSFGEQGKLPGEVELTIEKTSLNDGCYVLYQNKNTAKEKKGLLLVENGKVRVSLAEGGKYFLQKESEEAEAEELRLTGTKPVTGKPQKKPLGLQNGKPGGKKQIKETSNMVDVKLEQGMVSAEDLKKVQKTEKILRINGKMQDKHAYRILLKGEDIKSCEPFKAELTTESPYKTEIQQLAQESWILHFTHQGAFPAECLIEVDTTLEDGPYLLMRYDAENKKAEFVEKIQVEKQKAQFLVKEGGDYFFTKRVSTQSLNEDKNEEVKEEIVTPTEEAKQETVACVAEPKQEEQTQQSNNKGIAKMVLIAGCVLLICFAGWILLIQKKRK